MRRRYLINGSLFNPQFNTFISFYIYICKDGQDKGSQEKMGSSVDLEISIDDAISLKASRCCVDPSRTCRVANWKPITPRPVKTF
jgi:hypothetical protein